MPQLQAKLLQERRLPVKGAETDTASWKRQFLKNFQVSQQEKSLIFGVSCEILAPISID